MGYGPAATAGQVTGLYSAEVPVAGQSVEQRTDGIRRAFARMLIKVTGNRTVPQRPELQEDIAQATRYVQQFRYRLGAGRSSAAEPPAAEDGAVDSGEASRLLTVQFDSAAVQRLLRERRLPVWGRNRPSGLVWLGIESQGQRRVMRPELDAALIDAMTVTAEQRGVPLLLPLMDLEDQAAVQVADLWGDFEQNIRRASQRYTPDLIVTGRMTQLSGRLWRVTWRLYHGNRTTSWSDEGGDPVDLAREGAQHVGDLLAERYAPVGGEANLSPIRLRVSGVTALVQYAGVGRLLQSQSSVERADMVAVEPDAVIFELQVRGGIQVLEQGLALGGVIEPVTDLPDATQSLVEGVDLFYRMR
ncbi:DUF2066 domain-containing protein [Sedimenticola hydrogenitrophicus]|uniref:DUF2066 domain-containing protein n=1 Tax=Sedimenticola hydrogenitrophicus TaxID=2967975 RepID=UPI0021A2B147|nr:DUF2066 domain-containing protein [Sedimenticola hydrogenitrophicus]